MRACKILFPIASFLCWLLLPSISFGQLLSNINFELGLANFQNATHVQGQITFSEDPEVVTLATTPGGAPEDIYYELLKINGVELKIINANSNKPGMSRLSDIFNTFSKNFYNVKGGDNLLRPGLGDNLFIHNGVHRRLVD